MSTTMTKDPMHGTAVHGFGFGELLNKQSRTLWDLRPDDGGPPVKILFPVVDAKQCAENFPERYRYWWPGDETPERNPLTPEEIETQTHRGRIARLQAQLAQAQAAFTAIAANIAAQIELEHDAAKGK